MSDKIPEKVIIGGFIIFGLLLSNISMTKGLIDIFDNSIFRFSYLSLILLFLFQEKRELGFLGLVMFIIMDYLVQKNKANEDYLYAKEYISIMNQS